MQKHERIILVTENKENISKLIDKMATDKDAKILGQNYKVKSVGMNFVKGEVKGRIFELEG